MPLSNTIAPSLSSSSFQDIVSSSSIAQQDRYNHAKQSKASRTLQHFDNRLITNDCFSVDGFSYSFSIHCGFGSQPGFFIKVTGFSHLLLMVTRKWAIRRRSRRVVEYECEDPYRSRGGTIRRQNNTRSRVLLEALFFKLRYSSFTSHR